MGTTPLKVAATAVATTLGGATPVDSGVPRKNVVVINLDDAPDRMINPTVTPKIVERLEQKGVRFTDFYANNPQCGPSRCILLKGKYTHHDWMPNSNMDTFERFKPIDQDTLATRLNQLGYRTGLFGKYLNGYGQQPTYVPPGWDKWWAFSGGYESAVYQASEDGTVRDYDKSVDPPGQKAFDKAKTWIESGTNNDSKPFFAYIGPQSPHGPYDELKSRYGKHEHDFDGATHSSPGTQEDTPAKAEDKPAYIRDNAFYTAEERDKEQKHAEGKKEELRVLDDLVHNFLNFLWDRNELDHTLIVLTVDNGYLMGEHGGMDGKHEPYDESVRVTAIMRGPGIVEGAKVGALSGMIDLAPTIMNAVGGPLEKYDGRPLQPILLTGNTPSGWRNAILLEGPHYGWYGMIDKSGGNKVAYVERTNYIDELYDLQSDPYELNNKIYYMNDAEKAAVVPPLHEKLVALKQCDEQTCTIADRV
jgi:N-acetylglucosamine-6-sulfatase